MNPSIFFVIVFQEISSGCSNYQSFIVIFPLGENSYQDVDSGDEDNNASIKSCHVCLAGGKNGWHLGGYHGVDMHEKCYDKAIRSRHRMMRQALPKGDACKAVIAEDVNNMHDNPEKWRLTVNPGVENRQTAQKVRDDAFQFAKHFNQTSSVDRAVFRTTAPIFDKRGYNKIRIRDPPTKMKIGVHTISKNTFQMCMYKPCFSIGVFEHCYINYAKTLMLRIKTRDTGTYHLCIYIYI